MRTKTICIKIDETMLEEMRDIHRRLIIAMPYDKRTFEETVADWAVHGRRPSREWLARYE